MPALTVGLLLAWHHMTQQRWRLPREIVLGMYLESIVLAFGLLGIGYLERNLSQLAVAARCGHGTGRRWAAAGPDGRYAQRRMPACTRPTRRFRSIGPSRCRGRALATMISTPTARLVGFCGAGIYEEALFRLLLLPPVVWLLGYFP